MTALTLKNTPLLQLHGPSLQRADVNGSTAVELRCRSVHGIGFHLSQILSVLLSDALDTLVPLTPNAEATFRLTILAMCVLCWAELTPLLDIADTYVSLDVPSRDNLGSLPAWNVFVLE